VTLAADIAAELPGLRAEAEARMTSRVTIRRKSGQWTQDEDTGEEVSTWDVIYTELPFRLAGAYHGDAVTRRVVVGGEEYQQAVRTGHMPASTTDLADADLIDITSGENAGRVLMVVEATWQDQATARRVPVVEVERPEEW
jgi:hypothetical protein